jgi:hypothetical protein
LSVSGSLLKLSRRESSTVSSSTPINTAEGRNDLPWGDCPWRVGPKASFHDLSRCRETESMPLVKHTPIVLEISRHDLINRVNLSYTASRWRQRRQKASPPFCGQDMPARHIFSHEKLTAVNIGCHASTQFSALGVACTPARPTCARTTWTAVDFPALRPTDALRPFHAAWRSEVHWGQRLAARGITAMQ